MSNALSLLMADLASSSSSTCTDSDFEEDQVSAIQRLGPCPETGVHSRDGSTGYYHGTEAGVMMRDEKGRDLVLRTDLAMVRVGPRCYVVQKAWAEAWDQYDTQLHEEECLWQEAYAACPLPYVAPQEAPPRRRVGSMGFKGWKAAYDAAFQANKRHQAYMSWCDDYVAKRS